MSVQDRPLPIPWFTGKVAGQCLLLGLFLRFVFRGVWESELASGRWLMVILPITIFVGHLGTGLFEWAFHRWVLHSILFSWFARFAVSHRHHHDETKITTKYLPTRPGLVVISKFDMVEPGQFEGSAFPWWSLLGFWAMFSLLFIPLHLVWPRRPMLIGGYSAIALAYWLYEVIHAVHHYPQAWWQPKLEDPRFGKIWVRFFGFHRMHHYRKRFNMAIGGVFGFWLWDWIFRTYVHPQNLLIEGNLILSEDVKVHDPPRWVSWIDQKVDEIERRFRLTQQVQPPKSNK